MITKKVLSDSKKELLLTISMALAAATIPLHNNLNSYALVLFFFCGLLQIPVKEMFKKLGHSRYWMLPALYFLWLAATFFWDTSGGFSIKYLEHYATFLFIPVIMTIIPKLSPRMVVSTCIAFIIIVTLITVFCLIKSTQEYQVTGDFRVFNYHYLSQQAGLNAIFLSNYCLVSISWLLYFTFLDKRKTIPLKPVPVIFLCIYLLAVIFMLSSKLVIALSLVMVIFFIIYLGYIKKRLLLSFIILVLLAGSTAFAISRITYLNWRIQVTSFKAYQSPADDQNGLAARLLMFESATELIASRPLQGYGLKGAKEELLKKYADKNFKLGIEEKYNSHNQYLETALMSGLAGLAIFLSLLITILVYAIKRRQLLLFLIVVHFMCSSMVEATLEVQQELVFFWFFIYLFYYHYPLKTYLPGDISTEKK